MGLYISDKILGIRVLVGFADILSVVWEYVGNDWAEKLKAKREELEIRYDTLYYQVLREYSSSLERGENVNRTWIPYVSP